MKITVKIWQLVLWVISIGAGTAVGAYWGSRLGKTVVMYWRQ
jgi:hypothetical protein